MPALNPGDARSPRRRSGDQHPFLAGLSPPTTVFHEDWWLSAATGDRYQEVTVESGERVVARLPFVLLRKKGFTQLRMPPFTHVLGPDIDVGAGKPQTRMMRRLSLVRSLIDRLPPFDFFKQAVDSSIADALAFQDRGFQVSAQYTFEIDCRNDPAELWNAMHFKTRQHIRRAEEKYAIGVVTDPYAFTNFYNDNLRNRGVRRLTDFTNFPTLYKQSAERDAGEVLSAYWPNGKPAAMVYLVWGRDTMYYLLSTRANDAGDNGSVNLLIWSAMNRAHQRGLLFDLDGVSTSGTARFLSGFGGRLKMRMIVRRSRFLYGALEYAKRRLITGQADETAFYT